MIETAVLTGLHPEVRPHDIRGRLARPPTRYRIAELLPLELLAVLCQTSAMVEIARLAIALDEVDPPVRRRIEAPPIIRLDRLHRVLQIVMGWED